MRVASLLTAFIFLGVAAAGVIPDTAGRNTTSADGRGGKGNHTAPMSGIHAQPSGPLTGASAYPIQSNIPASGMKVHPTSVDSLHPISSGPEPTGTPRRRSSFPMSPPNYPTPSTEGPSYTPVSHGAQPTDGHSRFPVSHFAKVSGTHSYYSTQPTAVSQLHRSDIPSGASGQPIPSVSPARSAEPSNVRGHPSGSPSDLSIPPNPTPSNA